MFVLLQELQGHVTQVAEDLPCVSFDSTLSAAQCKLAQLVKTRNVMKFNLYTSCTGQSSSPFSAEEISLLQNMPKGTWKLFFTKSIRLAHKSSFCARRRETNERLTPTKTEFEKVYKSICSQATLDKPLIDTLGIDTLVDTQLTSRPTVAQQSTNFQLMHISQSPLVDY